VNVEVAGLRADYGSATILEDVGFGVPDHGAFAVVGRNGMGKSTLLKTVMGYLKPSKGTVTVAGRNVTGWPTHRLTRLGVSYAAQEKSLFGELSVDENLSVGKGRRCPPEVRDEVIAYFPVLGERLKQKAGTLSGGEQQMLALARAFVLRPRLLLLDEPSLGLAPVLVAELFRIVRELNEKEGLTVLVVEQNAHLALQAADAGYVLEAGHVVLSGSSAELRADDSVRRSYLGY